MIKLLGLLNDSTGPLHTYVKNVKFNGIEVEIYMKGARKRASFRHLDELEDRTFILTPTECRELNLPVFFKG